MIRRTSRESRPSRSGLATLVGGTSWQTLAQLAPLVINLVLTPYIIHGLGPQRYSVFLLVTSIAAMLGQFDGGIGQAALRFFTINVGRSDAAATTRLLCTVGLLVAACGALLTIAAFAATDDILTFFRVAPELFGEAGLLLRVLCALVGVLLLRNVFNSVLIASLHFRITATAILLGHLVYVVGLVLTVEHGWGLPGVAVTMIAQQILGTLVTLPRALRLLDRAGLAFLSREDTRAFFFYAWKVQVSGLSGMIQTQKDQLVAGRVLSAQESGPFGQGSNFASQIKMLPLNALAPFQAMIGAKVGQVGPEGAVATAMRLQRVWVRVITGWCVLGVPATFVGVRAWLPDSYADSAVVAAILVGAAFFPLAAVVLKVWTLSLGRPGIDVRASGVSLAANFAASLLLYPWFGMFGVVVGTAIGQASSALFYAWAAHRLLPVTLRHFLRDTPWWQGAVTLVLATGLALGVAPVLPRGVLGLLGAAAAALPAALVYVGLVFGREGFEWVATRLRRRSAA